MEYIVCYNYSKNIEGVLVLRKYLLFLMVFAFCFMSSIATASNMTTINNVQKKLVYENILKDGMKNGFTIKHTTEYSIVFEDNRTKPIKFSLNWGNNAKVLHLFNFVQNQEDVILSYEIQIISNPGTNSERIHVASKENISGYFPAYRDDLKWYVQQTENTLRDIKAKYNGIYLYGITLSNKKAKNYIEVKNVLTGFPAYNAGILAGDKVVKINRKEIKKLDIDDIHTILELDDEGAIVELTILRDNKEVRINLTKQFLPPPSQAS